MADTTKKFLRGGQRDVESNGRAAMFQLSKSLPAL